MYFTKSGGITDALKKNVHDQNEQTVHGLVPHINMQKLHFKVFCETVEAICLKLCTILKLVILHPEKTIAQVKCANFFNAHAQTFVLFKWRNGNSFYLLRKAEILVVVTLDRLLPEANRIFTDLFE